VTTVRQLANRYEGLPAMLDHVAEQYPGADVVRNDVGNLAVLTSDGTYIGYIDVLTGDWQEIER
jgi:hypothetical protein